MRTSLNIQNKLTMISEMHGEATFQILEYPYLQGSRDILTAIKLNQMMEAGIRLRQVRICLNDSKVRVEKGALSYLRGSIEVSNKVGGAIGFGKKLFGSKVTGEPLFKPLYSGSGEIFLEPSFGHFALIELEDDDIIIDDGLFYACEETVNIDVIMQKSISAAVFGDEGVFQTRLSGSGILVLELPVPETEIFKCKINNDILKIDGNFSILRTGDIEFAVEKSSKSVIGSITNGEGLVNVFYGTGEVWLIPTKSIYEKIEKGEMRNLFNPQGVSNTKTNNDN